MRSLIDRQLHARVGRRNDIVCILAHRTLESGDLLDNEKKVDLRLWRPSDVWDYRYNFALQAVQVLLQLALVSGHLQIESVDPVLHVLTSLGREIILRGSAAQRMANQPPPGDTTRPTIRDTHQSQDRQQSNPRSGGRLHALVGRRVREPLVSGLVQALLSWCVDCGLAGLHRNRRAEILLAQTQDLNPICDGTPMHVFSGAAMGWYFVF
jgi:hypothetical protein